MSDIRFNQWLHQSGTGGVSQDHIGNIGIGTTNPSIVVSAANTAVLNVGVITANNLFVNNAFNGDITGNVTGNISGATGTFSGNVDIADKIIHTGDTDTAMRFPADNTFAVDTAGSERLRITSAGLVGIGTDSPANILHLSSTGTPTIQITDEDNSGIVKIENGSGSLFLNADTGNTVSNSRIQFGIDGSERLRMDSTGRVGINTTTYSDARDSLIVAPPSGQTDVFFTIKTLSTNGNTRLQFADPDDTNVGDISYTHSNNAMVFKTGDSERLRITSAGLVGINSTSPATALDIQSTKNTDGLTITKAGTRSVFLGHNGSGNEGILVLKENGTTNVQIYAETNQNSYINSGNFGIGTNSPSYKLDVRPTAEDPTTGSPAAGSFSQIRADDATVGKGPSLSLMNLSGSKETGWRLSALTASGNNGDFTIHGYGGGATYSERLRITSNGRIGIGTDNPDQTVEINGNVKFTKGTSTEGSQMLVLPLEDITLASNASASIPVGSRFTGLIIVAGYTNDTAAGVWAVASASSYSLDAVTRLQFNNHPASNTSDLTITSPSHGGTHQFQLNQTGSSTKTYKVFAMGIYG